MCEKEKIAYCARLIYTMHRQLNCASQISRNKRSRNQRALKDATSKLEELIRTETV